MEIALVADALENRDFGGSRKPEMPSNLQRCSDECRSTVQTKRTKTFFAEAVSRRMTEEEQR
jgi:hypothetical protein